MKKLALFISKFDPISHINFNSVFCDFIDAIKDTDLYLFLLDDEEVSFEHREKITELTLLDYGFKLDDFKILKYGEEIEGIHFYYWLKKKQNQISTVTIDDEYLNAFNHDRLTDFFTKNTLEIQIDFESDLSCFGIDLDLPLEVLEYIGKNKLYYAKRISSKLKESRYLHSLSVAKTAYEIAKSNGLDKLAVKAYTAGLYHDIGKSLSIEKQRDIFNTIYKDMKPVEDFTLHQFAGIYIADHLFFIKDKEIQEAMKYHCTGKAKMNTLQKIIYAADKVEPLRDFETKELREACYKNIDDGFVKVLEDQVAYFKKNNIKYKTNYYSKKMYEYYLK